MTTFVHRLVQTRGAFLKIAKIDLSGVKLSDQGWGATQQPSPQSANVRLGDMFSHTQAIHHTPSLETDKRKCETRDQLYKKPRRLPLELQLTGCVPRICFLADSRVFLLSAPDTVTASTHVCCPACCQRLILSLHPLMSAAPPAVHQFDRSLDVRYRYVFLKISLLFVHMHGPRGGGGGMTFLSGCDRQAIGFSLNCPLYSYILSTLYNVLVVQKV